MPYVPPAKLSTLADVGLVLPSLNDILEYGSRTAGKWTNEPVAAGTTIGAANNPPLSGAVVLEGAGNVNIGQAGQNIILSAPSPQARTASIFFPGVMSARTGAKLIIPNASLTQLDAYFQTAAPAGVSGAACANVQVSGSSSGNYVLPFSAAQAEWHSGFLGQIVYEQTSRTANGTGGVDLVAGLTAQVFTPTAQLTVESVALNLCWANAPAAGTWARVGLVNAASIAAGQPVPTTLATLNNLWVTDQLGLPAYADIPLSSLPQGGDSGVTTWQLANPVTLANGTAYAIMIATINPARTALDTGGGINYGIGCGSTNAGNFTGNANHGTCFSPSGVGGNWASNGANIFPYFVIGGTGNGTPLVGTITVAITMTGAPATPGTDLNVVLQL